MKINEQDKKTLKETHDKWLNEAGWLAKLFMKKAARDIKNNKNIQKAVSDADKFTEKTRNQIYNIAKGDRNKIIKALPDKNLRKGLGFDF